MGGPRARRSNMHFTSSSTGGFSSSQSSYSPSNREAMDPIAGKVYEYLVICLLFCLYVLNLIQASYDHILGF